MTDMEISPQTFREVEFREKRHGYHPEDVDRFLERMEVAVEGLQGRLHDALERAERAESAVASSEDGEGMIRRTLVLAQRTADAAIRESRAEAAAIVASAQKQADAILVAADQRARQHREESLADVHAELVELEAARARGQEEVEGLNRWAESHRAHFFAMLREAATVLERTAVMSTPPSSTPIDMPIGLPDPTLAGGPALPSSNDGDDRVLAAVSPRSDDTQALSVSELNGGGTSDRNLLTDPDEIKLDSFFDDDDQDDSRSLGARVRRRP